MKNNPQKNEEIHNLGGNAYVERIFSDRIVEAKIFRDRYIVEIVRNERDGKLWAIK